MMKVYRYAIKLAIAAALAYAVGNAIQSRRISYVIYGAVLCMHPVAGDQIQYTLDKFKSAALGATVGLFVNTAFQGNTIAMLAVGPASMMTFGYLLRVPPRVLNFSGVVTIMAITGTTYSQAPLDYIGLRFWNIMQGAAVGIAVNLLIWPDRDADKLPGAFAGVFASLKEFYARVLNDYLQDDSANTSPTPNQLLTQVDGQLRQIEGLMVNAKTEFESPFVDAAPYQRWLELQTRVNGLVGLVTGLGVDLQGKGHVRLHEDVRDQLNILIQQTLDRFDYYSQSSTFKQGQGSRGLPDNLPALNATMRDRLNQLDRAGHLPSDMHPEELTSFGSFFYGLRAIATELEGLSEVFDGYKSLERML